MKIDGSSGRNKLVNKLDPSTHDQLLDLDCFGGGGEPYSLLDAKSRMSDYPVGR